MKNKKALTGFRYHLDLEKIREYRRFSLERRLLWLYYGNVLRSKYPKRVIKLQEKLRRSR
jgi:hypothetical protein